jgi:raffinose/stachyose/melibiose transport system substrate-binding protein
MTLSTRRKRLLSLTATVSGTALLLTGCGALNQGGGSDNKLSVWHQFTESTDGDVDGMSWTIQQFNKEHPDMKFENRTIANDEANTVIRTGLSGDNPPTVLQYEGYKQTEDYAESGALLDITDWWEENKQHFAAGESQAAKDACEWDGKMWCIPWNVDTSQQLYVNPALVEEHDLVMPETIDQLKENAKKLEGTGVAPISLYAGDGWPAAHWWFLLSIQRCGIDTILDAAKQDGAAWDDECFLQSATDLYELGEAGVFPEGVAGSDYNSMMQLYLSGEAAFMNTGSWFNSTLTDTPPGDFEPEAIPFPQVDPDNPSEQILGGFTNVFAVPANSGNTEAGLEFLTWMSNPENGAGKAFARGGLINMLNDSDEEMDDVVKTAYETVAAAVDEPGNNVIAYFENLVPPAVGEDQMYNGSASLAANTMEPEEFVKNLQAAAAASVGQ